MEKKNELESKLDSPEDCSFGTLTMDDKRLLRKVDWQILPIMFFTYFLQMIDKISINVCLRGIPFLCPTSLTPTSMQM